jgi:hypothetical protein
MTALKSIPRFFQPKWALAALVVPCAAASLSLMAVTSPMMCAAVFVATGVVAACFAWPDAPILAVVFVLYTNAAVIAVQFHHVPFIVGAAFPLLLLIPLGERLIFRQEKLVVDKVLPLILSFVLVQAVGAVFADKPDVAVLNLASSAVESIGFYFLLVNVIRTPATLRRVIWTLLAAGTLMGGLSVYQQCTGTFKNNYGGFAQMSDAAFRTGEKTLAGDVEQQRLSGPIGEQNRYAQIMLMLVPIGMFRLWGERSYWLRGLAVSTSGLCLAGAALTFSRGGAVGFVLMLVIMVLMGYIRLRQLVTVLIGLFVLVAALPQFSARMTSMKALSAIMGDDDNDGSSVQDGSMRSRLTEMMAAALVFADHPIVGAGPGMYPEHYREYAEVLGVKFKQKKRQAHNLYLGLAAEAGGLGLLCFLCIVVIACKELAKSLRDPARRIPELANITPALLFAVVVYLTTGLFLHFAFARYFWMILALAGASNRIAAEAAARRRLAAEAEFTDRVKRTLVTHPTIQ